MRTLCYELTVKPKDLHLFSFRGIWFAISMLAASQVCFVFQQVFGVFIDRLQVPFAF